MNTKVAISRNTMDMIRPIMDTLLMVILHSILSSQILFRVIFMEDHIPLRPGNSLVNGRQTSKWSLWDVIFHENSTKTHKPLKFGLVICHFYRP